MNPALETIVAAFDAAKEPDRTEIIVWMRLQLPAAMSRKERDEALRARVRKFPLTMESLAVARILRDEGYYSGSTVLVDIARVVERARKQSRAA